MWHVWGREELHSEFWWGNVRAGDDLEDLDEDGRIIFKWILKKQDGASLDCSDSG
jgi:hypothetical protein